MPAPMYVTVHVSAFCIDFSASVTATHSPAGIRTQRIGRDNADLMTNSIVWAGLKLGAKTSSRKKAWGWGFRGRGRRREREGDMIVKHGSQQNFPSG